MFKCECGNETRFYTENGFGNIGITDNINSDEGESQARQAIYLYCRDCDKGGQPLDFQM